MHLYEYLYEQIESLGILRQPHTKRQPSARRPPLYGCGVVPIMDVGLVVRDRDALEDCSLWEPGVDLNLDYMFTPGRSTFGGLPMALPRKNKT